MGAVRLQDIDPVYFSGKIGRGVSNPSHELEVHAGATPVIELAADDSSAAILRFKNSTTGSSDANGSFVGIDSSEVLNLWNHESTDIIFATNDSEVARLTNDGKLGIGTGSSPGVHLHVKTGSSGATNSSATTAIFESSSDSQISLWSATGGSCVINFGDSGDDNIGSIGYSHSNDSLTATVNASTALVITSNLFVGLGGVSSPNYPLHVHRSSTDSCYIQITNSDTGSTDGVGLVLGLDSSENGILERKGANALIIRTNDTNRIYVDGAANRVGIGKTTFDRTGTTLESDGYVQAKGLTTSGGFVFSDDTNTAIYNEYEDTLSLYLGGTARLFETATCLAIHRQPSNSSGVISATEKGLHSSISLYTGGHGTNAYIGLLAYNTASDTASKGAVSIAGARKTISNKPFMVVGNWDTGSIRRVYYGGGGWGIPDATQHSFYTDSSYDETAGGGQLRLTVNSDGSLQLYDIPAPSSTPSNSGYLYSVEGALYWKGSSGTSTKLADA